MNPILSQNLFLVKEHIGMFKAANNYDIYDPETNQIIMNCRENNLGFFTKIFRFTDYKRATPFDIEITTASGEKLISVKRGVAIFRSTVEVFDEKDRLLGTFKQKFFSIGGKFDILDKNEKPAASNFDTDVWELYNLNEDFNERINLAKKYPEKLAELQK